MSWGPYLEVGSFDLSSGRYRPPDLALEVRGGGHDDIVAAAAAISLRPMLHWCRSRWRLLDPVCFSTLLALSAQIIGPDIEVEDPPGVGRTAW